MRLRTLELTRYGRFTDHVLDFGPRPADGVDLHLIYGPNEAGKSTTTAAFLDLLFGIEMRSRYNFLHSYDTMRIGAVLELADGTRPVARIKRQRQSLLGPGEQPLPEGVLLGALGGMDRAAYQAMFCLDDETLEQGGEAILQSRSDVSHLLFAATAGLSDLSRNLERVRAEADGFYKFHARSGELAELKTELARLKDERDRIDTAAGEYARLVAAHETVSSQYGQAIEAVGRLKAAVEATQQQRLALRPAQTLREAQAKLAELADLPDVPLAWRDQLPDLLRDETKLAADLENAQRAVAQAAQQRDDIVLNPTAEAAAAGWRQLAVLRARHRTAELDLPVRLKELERADAEIAVLLRRLDKAGEPSPARLQLTSRQQARLSKLIKARASLEEKLEAATTEHGAAQRKWQNAQSLLDQAADGRALSDEVITLLKQALASAQASEHRAFLRVAVESVALAQIALSDRLNDLRPWSGTAAALAEIAVPDIATLDRWQTERDRLDDAARELEGECRRQRGEAVRLAAELAALGETVGLVGDQKAAELRSAREHAWAAHRQTLDLASADLFEAALRQDDQVTAARLGHQAELAALHQKQIALQRATVARTQAEQDAAELSQQLAMLQNKIATTAQAISPHFPADVTPSAIKAWLALRTLALAAASEQSKAEQAHRGAATALAECRAALLAALDAAGQPADSATGLDTLQARVRTVLDGHAETAARQKRVEDCQQAVEERRLALTQIQRADTAWRQEWSEACAACWLAELGEALTAAEVASLLSDLAQLMPQVQARENLAGRIGAMRDDQFRFRSGVTQLAAQLGLPAAGIAAGELAEQIDQIIHHAAAAREAFGKALQAVQEAEQARDRLIEAARQHGQQVAKITSACGVDSLDAVSKVLTAVEERQRCAEAARRAEADILTAMPAPDLTTALARLADLDAAALDREIAAGEAQLADQQQAARELFATQREAAQRVEQVGGDDEVARIEAARRLVLLEIETRATAYLRLRAGAAAVGEALRLYRDRHRSGMMQLASDAFRAISRGAYSGLSTRPEKDGEVLIAVGAETGAKLAADLSKGTRFQLYLALRAAGYHEFAKTQRPVPFIADDIMETFDDFRAEETFRLFGDMARVGQVIYLTHHRHLCDIARQTVPGVQVHELPTR